MSRVKSKLLVLFLSALVFVLASTVTYDLAVQAQQNDSLGRYLLENYAAASMQEDREKVLREVYPQTESKLQSVHTPSNDHTSSTSTFPRSDFSNPDSGLETSSDSRFVPLAQTSQNLAVYSKGIDGFRPLTVVSAMILNASFFAFLLVSKFGTRVRQNSKRVVVVLVIVAVAALAGGSVALYYLPAQSATHVIEPTSIVETASYVIYMTDGTTIYAKNGKTGQIEFSGTDARTTINQAISSLADGGLVFMRSGTYIITRDGTNSYGVWVRSNIILMGEGSSTVLKVADGNQMNCVYVTGTNVTIANIAIDGNKAQVEDGGIDANQNGIMLTGATNCKVINCVVKDSQRAGILIQSGSSTNAVQDCYLEHNGTYGAASAAGCHSNIFRGNICTDNVAEGLHSCEGYENIYVDNVVIGGQYGIHANASHDIIIAGNVVTSQTIVGITVDSFSYDITVNGNIVYNANQNGIVLGYCSKIVVTGNTVRSSGAGLLLTGAAYNLIHGNSVSENQYFGIYLYNDSAHNVVSGNLVKDNSQISPGTHNGICVDADYNVITNNKVSGTSHFYGILLGESAHNNLVTDNEVYNAGSAGPIFNRGTSNTVARNAGYATENSGTATISSGTSVSFAHGLAGTPTHVNVAFKTGGYGSWAWSANSTHITITVENSGTYDLSWDAIYES